MRQAGVERRCEGGAQFGFVGTRCAACAKLSAGSAITGHGGGVCVLRQPAEGDRNVCNATVHGTVQPAVLCCCAHCQGRGEGDTYRRSLEAANVVKLRNDGFDAG